MSSSPPACRVYSTPLYFNSDDSNAIPYISGDSWEKHVCSFLVSLSYFCWILSPSHMSFYVAFSISKSCFQVIPPFDHSLIILSFKLTNFRSPTRAVFTPWWALIHRPDWFLTSITDIMFSLPSLFILKSVIQHYSPENTLNPLDPVFLCICLGNPNLARPQRIYIYTLHNCQWAASMIAESHTTMLIIVTLNFWPQISNRELTLTDNPTIQILLHILEKNFRHSLLCPHLQCPCPPPSQLLTLLHSCNHIKIFTY